ncbi:Metallo-dependent phosphatase [Dentipellis sp. KUC8613]|nr:Metallo-dependent phosphatase [Dentipellis sp. KUC8613]
MADTEAKPLLDFPYPIPYQAYPPKTITTPTAVIHTAYNAAVLPPKPENGHWTRFVCISDTHQHVFHVPEGDVLLHSGDLTDTGMWKGTKITMDWLAEMPHPKKIIIAGNHDLTFHKDWYQRNYYRWHKEQQDSDTILDLVIGEEAREAGIVYLDDESYEFQTRPGGRKWTVYGSPWTPDFWDWAFNYKRGKESEEHVAKIPPKTDILLTHGPPYTVLDENLDGVSVGCEALLARLPAVKPRLHVFGHIHEGHGVQVGEWVTDENSEGDPECTVFVNAANWPAGRRRRGRDGLAVPFGGYGFQPVIVDLLDEPDAE